MAVVARENRGVGMENFQVSTPIYRSSPRVRVFCGPIGLGWIWPKTRNRVALNIFRNKNARAEFVCTRNRVKQSSNERTTTRLTWPRV
jgi:hypothetical protein